MSRQVLSDNLRPIAPPPRIDNVHSEAQYASLMSVVRHLPLP